MNNVKHNSSGTSLSAANAVSRKNGWILRCVHFWTPGGDNSLDFVMSLFIFIQFRNESAETSWTKPQSVRWLQTIFRDIALETHVRQCSAAVLTATEKGPPLGCFTPGGQILGWATAQPTDLLWGCFCRNSAPQSPRRSFGCRKYKDKRRFTRVKQCYLRHPRVYTAA